MAIFYIARSEIITPLPWTTFALPFSAAETRSKPPFLILVGAEDRLMTAHDINDAADALAQVGIPVQHITMADTGHGISDQGIQTAKDFLRHVLGGAA